MKTSKNYLVLLALALVTGQNALAQSYGEIRGVIKNNQQEEVPFATIKILQGTHLVGGTQANDAGEYHYKPLNPGTYEIMVMDAGHQTQPVHKISVAANEVTYVDVKLTVNVLAGVTITALPVDHTKTGADKTMYSLFSIDGKDLVLNSGYTSGDVKGVLEVVSSNVVSTSDGQIHVRGSRGDANGFFVDGVRTLGEARVPGLAIENVTFFTGGVPAMYGDVLSGVVIITTKSYFTGIRDKNMRNSAQAGEE